MPRNSSDEMAIDTYANSHSHESSPQPKDEPPDDQLLALKEEEVDDEEVDDDEGEDETGEEDQLEADDDALSAARFWRIRKEDRVQNQEIVERNVGELYKMMRTGGLNFTPDYQRDEVWTKSRKQGLLDSLFKGCPVPAIVLAQKKRADGRVYFNVIDGKQRLTTILSFMSGKLTYKNKISTANKDFCYQHTASVPDSILIPQADKKYFDERKIVCVEHYDLPTAQEEDIFKRIQQGMTLVTGEKSSVGNAPRQLFVKELIKEYLAPGKLIPKTINLDTKRGRPFINLASFVQICSHLPNDSISPTATTREKWVSQPDGDVDEHVKTRCRAALDEFVRLVKEESDPFEVVKQRVAPVEFQFIAVYLYITLDVDIPMKVRAQELTEMRSRVHKAFPNTVKANSTVYSFLWKQLEEVSVRSENGHEPLALMPDVRNIGPKPKTKAKAKITATVGSEDEITMSLDDESAQHELVSPKKRARPLAEDNNSSATSSPRPKATPKAKKMRM